MLSLARGALTALSSARGTLTTLSHQVLTELYNGLQQDSKHLIKLLASNKQYSAAERYVTSQLSHVTSHYNATCGMWQVYRAAHTTSTK